MQKNQYKDKYLVSPDKKEYEGLSLNYKNIFISLEIQNLQIDPLIIYKLLRSENCFYMQKTLPGHSAPFETIMDNAGMKLNKSMKEGYGCNVIDPVDCFLFLAGVRELFFYSQVTFTGLR